MGFGTVPAIYRVIRKLTATKRRSSMAYQTSPYLVDETPGTKHYCTCGESANKPYCDGSHETAGTGKTPAKVEIAETKKIAFAAVVKPATLRFAMAHIANNKYFTQK